MSGPIRVLVAEDDVDLQGFLRETLEAEGMQVQTAADGAGTLLAVGADPPDIVLLDLDLPDLDGLDVLSAVRRRGELPVIVLTGRRLEQDRVAGLERGADDYVLKPFSSRELIARIRTVLRRADHGVDATEADVLTHEGLVIDRTAREVLVEGRKVELTKREFDLLAFLAAHPRRVFSRQELLSEVWGSSEDWQVPATVTEHVRRVRLKLETDPTNPKWIHNVRGVGYRFAS
ncbi:MAG: two component transcriptional regulator, winged helix family [Acidimicrobiales bacterium]|nr:two component transcriptional regulator, winged helix family [Acidimicrobiales bacterium]